MKPQSLLTPRGFTLVETIIAAALVATAIVALAHLLGVGARQSADNRRQFTALLDAQTKLEELRAMPWRMGVDGLQPSASDALTRDVAGFHDEVHGYVRRWAITALTPDIPGVVALRVCVFADDLVVTPEACVRSIRARHR